MGTRSLTLVYNEEGKPLVNMYRQFDGYPSGHGLELAEFLKPLTLTNGISGNPTNTANGMGCLAAQMVMHFKFGIKHDLRTADWKKIGEYNSHAGGIYLNPIDARDCWQDYEYHVYHDKIEVKDSPGDQKTLFSGTWAEFHTFCLKPEERCSD